MWTPFGNNFPCTSYSFHKPFKIEKFNNFYLFFYLGPYIKIEITRSTFISSL